MSPNGFHGSEREAWERLEAPLLRVDDQLDAYAGKNGMSVLRNFHNWPARALQWTEDLSRSIELALADEKAATYRLSVVAWTDIDGQRFWRHEELLTAQPFEVLERDLPELLERGRVLLKAWTLADLEPTTS